MDTEGASNNERLLGAARGDNVEMLLEIFKEEDFDINYQDGLGNTALHYAISRGSTEVLEHILSHPQCDVDPVNRIQKATPLHLAVDIDNPDLRNFLTESLLDAGADTYIKDKNGDTAFDLVGADVELQALFRKARADATLSQDDIASDRDSSGPGSGGSDEE